MKNLKILLSGGGSGGPVTPLLAVVESLKERGDISIECLWLGTKKGPEKEMVERENIPFKAISSGKFRRYFSIKNLTDIFLIKIGFFQSLYYINKFKPDLVMSAGAFVSVPVAFATYFLRVPLIIHQQDARPGLANRLMAPFATVITTTFEKSVNDYGKKAIWIGNPIRQDFCKIKLTKREASSKFGLRSEKPVLVVLGGGTGATAINKLVEESVDELCKFCQIIHITGKDKSSKLNHDLTEKYQNYKFFEFLDVFGIMKAFTVAEVIVSRCGMSTLTELSQLGIASILIPMPDSHQEENAEIFKVRNAAIVLNQKSLDKESFIINIKTLINDQQKLKLLRENISKIMLAKANEKMTEIILKLSQK